MIMRFQMAQFVRNDVVDAINRRLDQIEVQQDVARPAAATPPLGHVTNEQIRI